MLEVPYLDSSKLLEKIKIKSKPERDNEFVQIVRSEILKIIENSKVRLFLVKNNFQLAKFIKKNIFGKKIVIGMGAGTISNWMRKLPELMR